MHQMLVGMRKTAPVILASRSYLGNVSSVNPSSSLSYLLFLVQIRVTDLKPYLLRHTLISEYSKVPCCEMLFVIIDLWLIDIETFPKPLEPLTCQQFISGRNQPKFRLNRDKDSIPKNHANLNICILLLIKLIFGHLLLPSRIPILPAIT